MFKNTSSLRLQWALGWLRRLKPVLILVVFAAVTWRVWILIEELHAHQEGTGFALSVDACWVAVAGLAYLVGAAQFGLFWRELLTDLGLAATRRAALRAYFIGSVGKYVPGKAWVVILRTGLLAPGPGRRLPVALTVLYETTSQMALGAALAGVCLVAVEPQRWHWWAGGLGIAALLGCVLHPAVFRRLAKLLTLPFKQAGQDTTPRLRYPTLARGSVLILIGWLLLAGSLAAVAKGIGVDVLLPLDWTRLCGAAALATAAGFVVPFMPSGIAVRELIIIELLAPRFGAAAALTASLLLRAVWTLTEVGVAGLLYAFSPRTKLAVEGEHDSASPGSPGS
jgi:hypothetical protein